MYNNNVKSSSIAGLLGVFLGFVGAHDWYLGNTKKGLLHLCLTASGIILMLISAPLGALTKELPIIPVFFALITALGYLAFAGNVVWGIIEGLIIIIRGDAGLAAQGYAVASAADSSAANAPENSASNSTPTDAAPSDSASSNSDSSDSASSTSEDSTSSTKSTDSSSDSKPAKSSSKSSHSAEPSKKSKPTKGPKSSK